MWNEVRGCLRMVTWHLPREHCFYSQECVSRSSTWLRTGGILQRWQVMVKLVSWPLGNGQIAQPHHRAQASLPPGASMPPNCFYRMKVGIQASGLWSREHASAFRGVSALPCLLMMEGQARSGPHLVVPRGGSQGAGSKLQIFVFLKNKESLSLPVERLCVLVSLAHR